MEGPLARYHAILLAVAETPGGIHSAELGRATQLPRSTAYRLATALDEMGYIQQSAPGQYELGPAIDQILLRRLLATQQTRVFSPVLRRLTLELGETAFCAKLECGSVSIIDAMVPPARDRAHIFPGLGKRPLDRCSSSRAILAFRDESEIDHWLDLEGRTGVAERETLQHILRQVRKDGYSTCDGEIDEGIFSIACPVNLGPFGVLYSIGVTGPTARFKERNLDEVATIVFEAAREASLAVATDVTERSDKPSRISRGTREEE